MTQSGHRNYCPATYVRGAFFLSFLAYIHLASTLWGCIFAPVAASTNTAMKGVVSEQTRRKGDIVTNSKEAMKKRADSSFKNTRMQSRLEKAARENHNLSLDYEVQAKIIREKTARLKALRLAKEAAEKKNSGA
ncbi:MAG: hypothetical protein WCC81_15570 [Pseudolabrys sp.]